MPPETQDPNPINPIEDAHQGKHALLLILTGVMLFVGGLALWFLTNNKVAPKSEPENLATEQTDQFANWKTYRNEEYGFEFEYLDESTPHEYVLHVRNTKKPKLDTEGAFSGYALLDYRLYYRNSGGLYLEPLSFALSVHPQPFSFQRREEENVYLKLEDAIEHYTSASAMWNENRTTRYIGDVQVSEKILDNFLSVFFLRDTILYEITMSPADHPIVQKMYSTFKFIDASTDEIKLIQKCPDEWIQSDRSTERPQYYILDGQRREMTEFDVPWVEGNCNLEKQMVNWDF